ncbi:MAG: hypothetical protein QGG64_12020 [Candidatus Latescibacteria bacterium]|nr:hypothetical protein [Candidatus Latescibacterota bacterium]
MVEFAVVGLGNAYDRVFEIQQTDGAGLWTVAVLEAIYRSGREERSVKMSEVA